MLSLKQLVASTPHHGGLSLVADVWSLNWLLGGEGSSYSYPLPTLVDMGPGGTQGGQSHLTEPSLLGPESRGRRGRGPGSAWGPISACPHVTFSGMPPLPFPLLPSPLPQKV